MTCVGTLGRTAIVPDNIVFSPDRNLAAIRTVLGSHFVKYLEFCLLSPDIQARITSASGSTAQPHLYLTDLRALSFPLSPSAEQEQIVAEVERRLSIISKLEAAIEANLKRAERLRQSILREAFAGRLVPQDPTDEPANVLLERVRNERNGQKNGVDVSNKKTRPIKVPEPITLDVVEAEQAELWESVGN